MRSKGFLVEEAPNGDEALKKFRKKSCPLVITAMHMPGMNGMELIRIVHEKSPATEVIVFSAHGTAATKDKLDRIGVFGYLEKPIRYENLLRMAHAALRSNRIIRLGYERKGPELVFSRERILVADDDPSVLEIISASLSEKGYSVTTVADGQQAYEKILINDFDLVICDINMPKMGGAKTVKAIRSQDPYCYILLISGEADQTDKDEAMENGANKFLGKPFSPQALLSIIGEIDFSKIKKHKLEQTQEQRFNILKKYNWFLRVFHGWILPEFRNWKFLCIVICAIAFGFIAAYMLNFIGATP
jgi:DNA-binding NtrC family response regulator